MKSFLICAININIEALLNNKLKYYEFFEVLCHFVCADSYNILDEARIVSHFLLVNTKLYNIESGEHYSTVRFDFERANIN